MMSRSLLPIAVAALVGGAATPAAATPAAAAPQQNHDSYSHSRAQTQAQPKAPVKVAAKSKARREKTAARIAKSNAELAERIKQVKTAPPNGSPVSASGPGSPSSPAYNVGGAGVFASKLELEPYDRSSKTSFALFLT